jgi:hypothetical protein
MLHLMLMHMLATAAMQGSMWACVGAMSGLRPQCRHFSVRVRVQLRSVAVKDERMWIPYKHGHPVRDDRNAAMQR